MYSFRPVSSSPSGDGTVTFWDPATGAPLVGGGTTICPGAMIGPRFFCKGERMVTSDGRSRLLVWQVRPTRVTGYLELKDMSWPVAWDAASRGTVIAATDGHLVNIFDLKPLLATPSR